MYIQGAVENIIGGLVQWNRVPDVMGKTTMRIGSYGQVSIYHYVRNHSNVHNNIYDTSTTITSIYIATYISVCVSQYYYYYSSCSDVYNTCDTILLLLVAIATYTHAVLYYFHYSIFFRTTCNPSSIVVYRTLPKPYTQALVISLCLYINLSANALN